MEGKDREQSRSFFRLDESGGGCDKQISKANKLWAQS